MSINSTYIAISGDSISSRLDLTNGNGNGNGLTLIRKNSSSKSEFEDGDGMRRTWKDIELLDESIRDLASQDPLYSLGEVNHVKY